MTKRATLREDAPHAGVPSTEVSVVAATTGGGAFANGIDVDGEIGNGISGDVGVAVRVGGVAATATTLYYL